MNTGGDAQHPTPATRPIVLIGLRASGKSRLGARLARTLGVPFDDLDELVCAALGVRDAGEAFASLGEPAFRRQETESLETWLSRDERAPGGVLALGGGTPTAPGAAESLRHAATQNATILLYLHAPPHVHAARLRADAGRDTNRPSLTGDDPVAEVSRIYEQRHRLYEQLAHRMIEVDAPSEAASFERLHNAVRALIAEQQEP
jgi:shikimate kinase